MLKISDYKTEKGNIDWKKFQKDQIELGERCYKCNCFILNSKENKKTLCNDCLRLQNEIEEKVSHSSFIKCPYSLFIEESIPDLYYAYLYEEGEHKIECVQCHKSFKIQTTVSYSFESPKRYSFLFTHQNSWDNTKFSKEASSFLKRKFEFQNM